MKKKSLNNSLSYENSTTIDNDVAAVITIIIRFIISSF